MKSASVYTLALMASAAMAQPQRHHNHMDKHLRRNNEPAAWVTEMVSTTETVDVTTTIWVTPGFVPPSASAPAPVQASSSSSPAPAAAAQFIQSVPAHEEPSSAASSQAAPVQPTQPPAQTYAPEPSTPAVVAPTTQAAQPVAPSSAAGTSSGSSSGECSQASPCTGDATFYDTTGTGSCGYPNVDGTSEPVVALPVGLMGSLSNSNPMCGKTVTVKFPTGKTVTARVVDKCMGCEGRSIDLSHAAFDTLANEAVGRQSGATWWFN